MKTQNTTSEYILGLDIGSNSVGWAIIETNQDQPIRLIRTGARVFEAGVEGDIESGKDQSRGVKRRDARLHRRMLDRTGRRLTKLANLLQGAGLLPAGEIKLPDRRNDFFVALDAILFSETDRKAEPHTLLYRLRARALDERLTPHELGRALYHLAQRRGFLSNRKNLQKEDQKKKEEEGMKAEISGLEKDIREHGARTLGEYFSKQNAEEKRIRQRHTSRQMYQDEFEKIWQAQTPHHPAILTDIFKKQVHRAIFFQRPLKSVKHLIGRCELEPDYKRAPIALMISQQYRIRDKINTLEMTNKVTGEVRRLTDEERKTLFAKLDAEGDLTFTKIRKAISTLSGYEFNLERRGKKKLTGNRTSAKLKAIFKERWDAFSDEEKDCIVEDARSIQKDQALARRWKRVYGLDDEAVKEIGKFRWKKGISLFHAAR